MSQEKKSNYIYFFIIFFILLCFLIYKNLASTQETSDLENDLIENSTPLDSIVKVKSNQSRKVNDQNKNTNLIADKEKKIPTPLQSIRLLFPALTMEMHESDCPYLVDSNPISTDAEFHCLVILRQPSGVKYYIIQSYLHNKLVQYTQMLGNKKEGPALLIRSDDSKTIFINLDDEVITSMMLDSNNTIENFELRKRSMETLVDINQFHQKSLELKNAYKARIEYIKGINNHIENLANYQCIELKNDQVCEDLKNENFLDSKKFLDNNFNIN